MLNPQKIIQLAPELRDYIISALDAQAKNNPEPPISFFRLNAMPRGKVADVLLTLHVGHWDKKVERITPDAALPMGGSRLTMLFDVLYEFVHTWQHCRVESQESNPDISTFDVNCFRTSQPQLNVI